MNLTHNDKVQSRVKYSALIGVSVLLAACGSTPQSMSFGGKSPEVTNSLKRSSAPALKSHKAASGELKKAISYWGNQFKKSPKNAQYALNYAKNLKFAGQEAAAIRTLVQAQTSHPKNKAVAGELGRLLLKRGQLKRAEPLLVKAMDRAKPDWKILSALGTVNAQKGNLSNARTYFGQALSLKPNKPSLLVNIATTYMLENKASEAESFLRRAHAVKPTAQTTRKLKQVLAAQGKPVSGIQVARSLDPRRAKRKMGAPTTTASTKRVVRENIKPLNLSSR